MEKLDLILKKGFVFLNGKFQETDLGIANGKIAQVGDLSAFEAKQTIEAKGLHILPGVIDTQVHFREPGLEHKEDLESGTKAALRGGVTAVFEMPNTNPSTTTLDAINDKLNRAKNRCWTDYAFYVGASNDNIDNLGELEKAPGVCGIKIFMGSSTGSLLVSDDFHLEKILRKGKRRIAIHAEDEPRLIERKKIAEESKNVQDHPIWRDEESAFKATRRILDICKKTFRPVHILHVTTAQEVKYIKDFKDQNHKSLATMEITPNHLTLHAPDCYEKLGSLAQMNPPVRGKEHMDALWKAINSGLADVIGTDHAPHTLEEKKKPYPNSPSGMPGVQTLVPLMLNHVNQGKLSLEKLVDLICIQPAKIWDIKDRGEIEIGKSANLTIIDLNERREITHDWLISKCGWSPYEGMSVTGWPKGVILRGEMTMWEDEILHSPQGVPLQFNF